MIPLCKEFEEKLIKHIWRTRTIARKATPSVSHSINPSVANSEANLNEKAPATPEASKEQIATEAPQPQQQPQRKWWSWRLNPKDKGAAAKNTDPEKKRNVRKLVLLGPFYAGCGAALSACEFYFRFAFPPAWRILDFLIEYSILDFMSSGAGILLEEFAMDRNAARFGLLATLPIIFCISVVSRNFPTFSAPLTQSVSSSSVCSLSVTYRSCMSCYSSCSGRVTDIFIVLALWLNITKTQCIIPP